MFYIYSDFIIAQKFYPFSFCWTFCEVSQNEYKMWIVSELSLFWIINQLTPRKVFMPLSCSLAQFNLTVCRNKSGIKEQNAQVIGNTLIKLNTSRLFTSFNVECNVLHHFLKLSFRTNFCIRLLYSHLPKNFVHNNENFTIQMCCDFRKMHKRLQWKIYWLRWF